MKVVIIGASFAGIHCALRAKQLYPYDQIILIEKEEQLGYLPSGLTLLLNGKIKELDEATFMTKEVLENKGIRLMLDVSATDFNFEEDYVETTSERIYYDKLVLAMGSSQISQKLVSNHPGFLTYKKKSEAKDSLKRIESSKEIAVIGAGQTGMELASALVTKGKKVKLFESMNYPLYKSFDPDVIEPLINELNQEKNITSYLSCDSAFLATNVRPDLSMFKEQLEYHTDQTLKVDEYFKTSQPNVFAIGDLVQVPSMLLKQSLYLPLINNAVRSGQVCAENLENKKVAYHGAIRVIGTHIFNHYLASCGLTEADSFLYEDPVESLTLNLPVSTVEKEKTVRVKFTYNEKTKVLLGAQMISKANILEKINTYALAIDLKMTIQELAQKDYFYRPLYANPVSDMIQLSQRG